MSFIILVSTILNIIAPFMLEKALDSKEQLAYYLSIYFGCLLMAYCFNLLFFWIRKRYSIRIKTVESLQFSEYIHRMQYHQILSKEPTYIINRIGEAVFHIYNLISEGITQIITGVISLIALVILMYRYSTFLALLYIGYTALSYLGYQYLNRFLLKKSMKLQDVVASNYKNILSFMTNVDFLKLLPKFSYIVPFLKNFFKSSAKENADVGFYAEGISTLLEFVLVMVQSSIYIYVFVLYGQGKITFAQVAVIVLLNGLYRSAMTTINSMNINLRDVRASIHFINADMLANFDDHYGEKPLSGIESLKVDIKDISYGENLLIKEGVLEAKKGDIVGLSGESGTGKSTLIKHLLGLYQDGKSGVSYNHVDISKIKEEDLKEHILYISQNPAVFPITLQENFLLGNDEREKEQKVAQLSEMIAGSGFESFQAVGLDTLVLEGGSNLSGGDKQKIAIGRVLLKKVDLLILDEFSNSIDSDTETFIMNRIKEEYRNKIVIIITHNPKLLESCNKIYELSDQYVRQVK
jgi:subfamily B ATP-binding cassette protein MsbA